MSLLTEVNAFYLDRRRRGELEAGVDGEVVRFPLRVRGQHGPASERGRPFVGEEDERPRPFGVRSCMRSCHLQ
jgi:hypothetical protein